MARTKGMLNLSGNLEVNAGAPLDARSVVPTVADLMVAANFQYKYIGMTVTVQATGDMYTLLTNDVTDIANWKKVGSGGGGSSYTAGDGIDITNDEISVKAGSNLSFDSSGNLNATDTKYTAGTNVSISNQNVISATDTTYTKGDGIDITNNVISVDEMASADMAEIVTPLPSVMSRLPILFDETSAERIIGWYKYSDGTKKPLYQKTITFTTQAGENTLSHGIANVDKFVNAIGGIHTIGQYAGFMWPLMFIHHSAKYQDVYSFALYWANTTQFAYFCGSSSGFPDSPAFITFQYTKTTDTPV